TPRMHGLRPHTKARSNLRRPDGNRLAGRLGGPTRHGPIVAFSATPVKIGFTARRRGNTTARRWPPPRAATLTSGRRPEIDQSGAAKNLWAGGGMSRSEERRVGNEW